MTGIGTIECVAPKRSVNVTFVDLHLFVEHTMICILCIVRHFDFYEKMTNLPRLPELHHLPWWSWNSTAMMAFGLKIVAISQHFIHKVLYITLDSQPPILETFQSLVFITLRPIFKTSKNPSESSRVLGLAFLLVWMQWMVEDRLFWEM